MNTGEGFLDSMTGRTGDPSSSHLVRFVLGSSSDDESATSSALRFISLLLASDTRRGDLPKSSVMATAAIMAMRSCSGRSVMGVLLASVVSCETQRGEPATLLPLGREVGGPCG